MTAGTLAVKKVNGGWIVTDYSRGEDRIFADFEGVIKFLALHFDENLQDLFAKQLSTGK